MNIEVCSKGHCYDNERYSTCPICDCERLNSISDNVNEEDGSSASDYFSAPLYRSSGFDSNKKNEPPYIFISYSHNDAKEVLEVISFLKTNHFNVWYDEGIKSGSEWADEIARRIKHSKQFICFMSENSVLSKSVKDEIHIAWKYNINTIVIYLEKVELDGGLELQLDRKQAILKYSLTEEEFRKKLSLSIAQDVLNIKKDNIIDDVRLSDKYQIINTLSDGGTSTVYLAKNKNTGVDFVLKCSKYDNTIAGNIIRKSFENEKKVLSQNISPFIPALYDYFYDSQNIYIAESFIEGTPISELRYLSVCEKIKLFIKAAGIINELHKNGFVHCDIKPEHILVNRHGCFIIDLGTVKDLNSKEHDDYQMGTAAYAAPEQFTLYKENLDAFNCYSGDTVAFYNPVGSVDVRTDIYAFGRTMIKTFSDVGKLNEDTEENVTTVLFASATKTLGKFGTNPLLQAIIEKMVREKKEDRYQNMDEVICVLEDYLKIYNS